MHPKISPARLEELRKMDQAHHLHPFTDHAAMHPTGTHVITSGEGIYLYGEEGKLLDGLAGLWCVNVGYGRTEIADAVSKQIRELSYYPSFFNTTTEAAVLLADRLGRMAPGNLKYAVFSNSGSEANETGLKIIRQYQILKGKPNRTKILTRHYAYHGVTLATASMTGLPNCQQPFGLPLPGFLHAPAPYAYAVGREKDAEAYGQECVAETRKLIQKEGPETIGAMILEPVQGAGGVIVPPPGYLAAMRKLAREYDMLFVTDEVISGFGRMGCWFLSEMWDLQPDLMILAKGLTSGYVPMGATMVAQPIAEALMKGGYFAHGFTYTGHPVSAAAALANLDIIAKEKLVERTKEKTGPYFQKKLQEFVGHPAVGEVRGLGLIGAMELVPKGGRKDLKPGMNLGILGAAKVRKEGAIVRGIRDLLAFSPPLVITEPQIDEMFAAVRRGIDKLWD
ncbi:MAG: aspartate aminotransferase family protein [Candidatus Methylacidiphilales bacterium]